MSKKVETRKCAVCGKKFTPKTANASVCSDKCRKAHEAERSRARREAKKSAKGASKHTLVEKVVLPKKPVAAKKCDKKCKHECAKPNRAIDTIISVQNGNPFKVFLLATLICERALREIMKSGLVHAK